MKEKLLPISVYFRNVTLVSYSKINKIWSSWTLTWMMRMLTQQTNMGTNMYPDKRVQMNLIYKGYKICL